MARNLEIVMNPLHFKVPEGAEALRWDPGVSGKNRPSVFLSVEKRVVCYRHEDPQLYCQEAADMALGYLIRLATDGSSYSNASHESLYYKKLVIVITKAKSGATEDGCCRNIAACWQARTYLVPA